MTHFFPSGITEGLLEHTWGAGGAGRAAPSEERHNCQTESKDLL